MFKIISKRQYELYSKLEQSIDLLLQQPPDPLLAEDMDEEPISTSQRIDLLKIFYKRLTLGIYGSSLKNKLFNSSPKSKDIK